MSSLFCNTLIMNIWRVAGLNSLWVPSPEGRAVHSLGGCTAALGSGGGPRGAVLRAPGVAVAPSGRAGSLSRGRPASGPRAEWAGTTAPRSRGALRPAAPGAGGYKWSGGSVGRLSPPRVAAASAAFGPSSLKKKREKDKKNPKTFENLKKKNQRKRKRERKSNPPRRTRGEVTFARFRPARARRRRTWASVGPARRSGGEPPASTRLRSGRRPPAPRGSPAPAARARAPRAPAARTTCPRCPSPPGAEAAARSARRACRVGTDQYLVSLFPGRCNLKPPAARGLYLSCNACPGGRRGHHLVASWRIFIVWRGSPHFNLFFFLEIGSFRSGPPKSTNSPGGPYCFCEPFVCGFAVSCEPSPNSSWRSSVALSRLPLPLASLCHL